MRYLLLFMLLVAVFVLGKRSCHFSGIGVSGSGPVRTETRNVSDFHGVDLDLAGDVVVKSGDFKVEVQAQESLLPLLKTTVENGILRLYFDESVSNSQDIKISITLPALDEIILGGSGEIRVNDPIQADKMRVDISGSGNVYLTQATINDLNCSLGGSGEIEFGGKTNTARIDLSGSGEVNAKSMEFNELKADISGSGNISAHVVQLLKADVSGSGEVHYSGEPKVESQVSGSGSVSRL